jgi:hypothetical protein
MKRRRAGKKRGDAEATKRTQKVQGKGKEESRNGVREGGDCAEGRCAGKCPGCSESRQLVQLEREAGCQCPDGPDGQLPRRRPPLAGLCQNVGCVPQRGVDAQTGAWIWGSRWGFASATSNNVTLSNQVTGGETERVMFWQADGKRRNWHDLPRPERATSVECSEAIGDADAFVRSAQPAVTRPLARTFDWAKLMRRERKADRAKGKRDRQQRRRATTGPEVGGGTGIASSTYRGRSGWMYSRSLAAFLLLFPQTRPTVGKPD